MKNSKEVANNVLRRRDAYQESKRKKEIFFQRITTSMTAAGLVVCMVFCLGVGYVFAAAFGVIDDFLGFFEKRNGSALSEKQQQYVEQACAEIGESVTYDGVTVTVQGAITDGKTYYIYLEKEGELWHYRNSFWTSLEWQTTSQALFLPTSI